MTGFLSLVPTVGAASATGNAWPGPALVPQLSPHHRPPCMNPLQRGDSSTPSVLLAAPPDQPSTRDSCPSPVSHTTKATPGSTHFTTSINPRFPAQQHVHTPTHPFPRPTPAPSPKPLLWTSSSWALPWASASTS